jgi:hypothetical protein
MASQDVECYTGSEVFVGVEWHVGSTLTDIGYRWWAIYAIWTRNGYSDCESEVKRER